MDGFSMKGNEKSCTRVQDFIGKNPMPDN